MLNVGLIEESTFSLYLTSTGKSSIHFGTPVDQAMKDKNTMAYVELNDDLFWAGSCEGVAFNDVRNSYAIPDMGTQFVQGGQIYSIFDSASSTI